MRVRRALASGLSLVGAIALVLACAGPMPEDAARAPEKPGAEMHGSEPTVVSEVIFRAATDGTDQLRYTAGDDAAQFMAQRKAASDEEFIGGLKKQFGLQQ